MSLEQWLPLPASSLWYEHQVGGHGLIYEKKGRLRMLDNNVVLKPVQKFPKGLVELGFYQKVFDPACTDPVLLSLRPFVPTYKGLYFDSRDSTYYIGMEDILRGLQQPSLIDCKMGRKTFDPYASETKVLWEMTKYYYREAVGFLITGIKVFHSDTGEFTFFDRFHGRSLDFERVYTDGILHFLGPEPLRAQRIARACLRKLRLMLTWFESQQRYSFYASSILLAYGEPSPITGECQAQHHEENVGEEEEENVVVKWVDFTHVLDNVADPTLPQGRDENFLFGLRNLVHFLERAANTNNSSSSSSNPTTSTTVPGEGSATFKVHSNGCGGGGNSSTWDTSDMNTLPSSTRVDVTTPPQSTSHPVVETLLNGVK